MIKTCKHCDKHYCTECAKNKTPEDFCSDECDDLYYKNSYEPTKQLKEIFSKTVFLVEATDFERHALWEKWHDEFGIWAQASEGDMQTIGYVTVQNKIKPIILSFLRTFISGHQVMFYYPSSQSVDYEVVDKWIKRYCNPQYDNNSRRAHCNAANFHHCAHYIQGLPINDTSYYRTGCS